MYQIASSGTLKDKKHPVKHFSSAFACYIVSFIPVSGSSLLTCNELWTMCHTSLNGACSAPARFKHCMHICDVALWFFCPTRDRDRERERETSKRSQIKFAPLKIQQDFLREGCTANNPSLWPESWHLSLSLPLPSPPPFPVWPRNGQCWVVLFCHCVSIACRWVLSWRLDDMFQIF